MKTISFIDDIADLLDCDWMNPLFCKLIDLEGIQWQNQIQNLKISLVSNFRFAAIFGYYNIRFTRGASNFKAQTSLSSVVARNILMGKSAKAFSNNNKNDLDVEMKVAFGTFSSAKWQMIL